MNFSNKLKEVRLERNLTEKQVAELVGIHPKTYKKYENGKTVPRIPIARNLCIALNISCDELLEL